MTTRISTDNFQPTTLDSIGGAPTVSNVRITDSSYNVLDDTAVSTSGGFLRIEGRKFAANCQVLIEETPASVVSFVNSSVVTAQVQARTAGTYMVYVVNPDGSTGVRVNGLTYSDTPTWVTASTLSNTITEFAFSQQLSATGANVYTVAAGSSLPANVTLSSNGLLSGFLPKARSNTTYSFTINAIDSELQDSPRTFTQTVVADIDPHYMNVPLMLTGSGVAGANSTMVVLDSSTTNNGISANGNVSQSTWSPYISEEWSMAFNGSNSFVSSTNTSVMAFGANNWTVEAWVRFNNMPTSDSWASWSNTMVLAAVGSPSAGDGFNCIIGSTLLFIQNNESVSASAVAHGMVPRVWYHVAFVRDGNTIRFFVDGVARGTASYTGSVGTGSNFWIGTETGQGAYFDGLIRELRITRNQALYTTAFTPPATTLQTTANTTLLVAASRHMSDMSASQIPLTPSNTRMVPISRKNDKSARYSSNTSLGSVYYFANTHTVRTAASVMNFGTNDFTVEGWVNLDTMPTSDNWVPSWSSTMVLVGAGTPSAGDGFNCIIGSTVLIIQSNDVPRASTVPHGIRPGGWYHLAYVRQSGVINFYVNGEARGNVAFANAVGTGANTFIGCETGEGAWLRGYLTDLRVVNGVAVYTAPFTPPTAPLATVANTTLHVRMNNIGIADASVNTVTFSAVSNAVVLTTAQSRYYGTSLAFNGANTLIRANSSIMTFGANNWTVEAWVRLNAMPTSDAWPTNWFNHMILIESGTASLGDGMACIIGQTKLMIQSNDVQYGGTAHGMVINTWYHIAYVRDGNTMRFFVNGTPTGTAAISGSVGTGAFTWIGVETGEGAYLNGFINDLRVTRNVARYTSAFTPPITTLPLAA